MARVDKNRDPSFPTSKSFSMQEKNTFNLKTPLYYHQLPFSSPSPEPSLFPPSWFANYQKRMHGSYKKSSSQQGSHVNPHQINIINTHH